MWHATRCASCNLESPGSFAFLTSWRLFLRRSVSANCDTNDGTSVECFICEPYAVEGMPDITHFGGWRAYSIKP